MVEKTPTAKRLNIHAILLSVIGIVLVIAGAAIINIPGAPLRGSGMGTLIVLLGIVLLFIALLRFLKAKRA
jgi:hypothetical protein